MRDKKVLLVGLPTLLEDILEEAIERAFMRVVSVPIRDQGAVECLVEEVGATAVLFGFELEEPRELARQLRRKFPDLAVLTLSDGGRCLQGVAVQPVWVRFGETSIDELVGLLGWGGD